MHNSSPVCWEQAGHCQAMQRGCHRARPQSAFPCNCTSKAGAPEGGCWALGFSHDGSLVVLGDFTVPWRCGGIGDHCGIPPFRGREHHLHLPV